VWVLTGYGAKPGGLGPGVNRLDASTLAEQSRIPIGTNATVSIGTTDTSVWLLGPTELDRIDPRTDVITTAKTFPHLFAEALATVPHDVLVGCLKYPGFEKLGPVLVSVTTFPDTDVQRGSTRVIAKYPSRRGDAPAMDLAGTSSHEIYIGLFSVNLGEALVVDRDGHVLRPDKEAGDRVAVSDTGIAWAAKDIPPVAATRSTLQRISDTGGIERVVTNIRGPVWGMAASGSLLYVATNHQLVVVR